VHKSIVAIAAKWTDRFGGYRTERVEFENLAGPVSNNAGPLPLHEFVVRVSFCVNDRNAHGRASTSPPLADSFAQPLAGV